ncbi:MAG: shikimate dehydrogenase [Saprospiraceae bacterium]|nr:shikimate dehydrogenase [Saprospiraceae bacterium]
MPHFGLLGKKLSHSFSKTYFEKKWANAQNHSSSYDLYEIENVLALESFLKKRKDLAGLNVTIPYKEQIIPYLDALDPVAFEIGAVNCLLSKAGSWVGYNTDGPAFLKTLEIPFSINRPTKAIVLGAGGAAKAVVWAFHKLAIPVIQVSRNSELNYQNLRNHWTDDIQMIVNTTPLGMFPDIHTFPNISYELIKPAFIAYDLIYNPDKTVFLQKAEMHGAQIINGKEMLKIQADLSEEIWMKNLMQ